jgi:ATP-dependent Lon protease
VKEAELVESSPPSSSATTNPAPAVTAPLLSPASLQLPIVVNVASLSQYVGKPVHSSDRMYETNPVGVATGLGTNSIGGSLLYIECTTADQAITLPEDAVRVPSAASAPTTTPKKKGAASSAPPAPQRLGRGELFCTGQLGDVIKESSSIAYTVAKRLVAKYTHDLSPHRSFFEQHRIHLHMPEGATPKDGPSAGIAMVTALLSLALNCAPLHAHAMTGELTLTGKVLGIGGVKEKLMAAKHAGIRTVILPLDNQKDVVELKPYVIEGLDIHYAAEFDDVFQRIFPHFVDHVEPPFADHARIGMDALTSDKKPKKKTSNKRATNDSNTPAASDPSILPPLQQPTAETKQPNAN